MKLINLPNIVTCGNLLCGCLAILFGLRGDMGLCCISIVCGAVFDFLDGLVARAMHISGPIGKELDSLADVVTFGVAPSVLCYTIIDTYVGPQGWLSLVAFVMAAFSALRLAKFNVDVRQATSFVGLPTPANAILWIGLYYIQDIPSVHKVLGPWVFVVLMAVCCWMLICELPMFSLKVKPQHNGLLENKTRYSFIALTVVILAGSAIMGFRYFCASPAVVILLYLLLSVIDDKVRNK